jgi:hypothetical protein
VRTLSNDSIENLIQSRRSAVLTFDAPEFHERHRGKRNEARGTEGNGNIPWRPRACVPL